MKKIHGTFNSFTEMGKAMGMKTPKEKTKTIKCKNCGGMMTAHPGTNVHTCKFSKLENKKLGETEVQVFTECGNVIIDEV